MMCLFASPVQLARKTVQVCLVAMTVCLVTGITREASAQLTVRSLIGEAVTDTGGPQYKEVADAIVRFRNADFAGTRKLLDAARSKNPQLAPASVMLSQMFFAVNQVDVGRATLEEAVKEDREDPESYLIFGDLAFRDRQYTTAELLFARGEGLTRKYTGNEKRKRNLQIRSYAGISAVYEVRERWADAERFLGAWIKTDPNNVAAYTRLARTQFRLKKEKEAYASFQKLYEIDNKQPRPELNMALLYERDDRTANARGLVKKAVERDKNTLNTRLAAANWFLSTGERSDRREAKANALAAERIDDKSVQAKLLVGLSARFDKDFVAAERAFSAANLLSPNNFDAVNHLALSLIEQADENKRNRALAYANLNRQINSKASQPRGREAAVTMAWVLFRLGREIEADNMIQQILRAGGLTAESAYFAARILNDRGKVAAAAQVLKPILESEQQFPNREDAKKLYDKTQNS